MSTNTSETSQNHGPVTLFRHEAMNTTFTIRFRDAQDSGLKSIVRECFDHLDELENHLSRYREGSDIHQVNNLKKGETLLISESCHQCLLLAMQAYVDTRGLFDITLGTRIEFQKSGHLGDPPPVKGQLMIDPERPRVTCLEEGREIDLGGIGKGFALDRMRNILGNWNITNALLAAGASTQLAFGNYDWPVELVGDKSRLPLQLANSALSASGTGIQGNHIISPLSPEDASPDYAFKRAWCLAETAAMADAWTTALMLMTPEEISEATPAFPYIKSAFFEKKDGEINWWKR